MKNKIMIAGTAGLTDLKAILHAGFSPETEIVRASLATVSITSALGTGSGFFISANGHIITNRHVLMGDDRQKEAVAERIEAVDSQVTQADQHFEMEKNRLASARADLDQMKRYLEGLPPGSARRTELEGRYQMDLDYLRTWEDRHQWTKEQYLKQKERYTSGKSEYRAKIATAGISRTYKITLKDGTELDAFLVRTNAAYDLALLKVSGYRTPHIQPAESGRVSLGQDVFAIGSPTNLRNSVSKGIFSGFRDGFLQTDDGISPEIRLRLNTPIRIGGRTIQKRLILSPMSGLTHMAFRELLAGFGGCGLMFTEMCSAGAVPHENRRVSSVFRWRDAELDELVCQLVGSDPAQMAEAARRIEAEGFFGVDLNFGCSVGTICRKNCGAALLKTPDLAVQIVCAVRQAVSIPVFVKFRTGWKDKPEPAAALARRFEDAGADALVFHPRVAPDRRTRPPRWTYIAHIRQAVAIPVFGNGDVFSGADLERIMRVSGCDGVSLGRIAVAMPWVFSQWTAGVAPGPDIFRDTLLRHLELLLVHFETHIALRKFRQAALYPAAMFQYGHVFYKKIRNAGNREKIAAVINDFFDGAPRRMDRPNMNLIL